MLLQIRSDITTYLQERNFANLSIILRFVQTFFRIEKALLRLAHLYTRKVAKQVTFVSDVIVFASGNKVLAFECQQVMIILVCLPKVA